MSTGQNEGNETEMISVAEAKRRFSELIDRVSHGERFIVSRRGRPAVALIPPEEGRSEGKPLGLAAVAGALADRDDIDEFVKEIYAVRRRSGDRDVPDLE